MKPEDKLILKKRLLSISEICVVCCDSLDRDDDDDFNNKHSDLQIESMKLTLEYLNIVYAQEENI